MSTDLQTDSQMRFLRLWLNSDQVEVPVLLTSGDGARLLDVVNDLSQESDTEVLRMPDDQALISIDQIRALMKSLVAKSLYGRRLVIISSVERISGPAASALLKSLEEPARTTRFLLTSVYPRRLLKTILSRCQRVWVGSNATANAGAEVDQVVADLDRQLRGRGPGPELRQAYMRLRDYYKILSLKGNTKLAREVLFASLPRKEYDAS